LCTSNDGVALESQNEPQNLISACQNQLNELNIIFLIDEKG